MVREIPNYSAPPNAVPPAVREREAQQIPPASLRSGVGMTEDGEGGWAAWTGEGARPHVGCLHMGCPDMRRDALGI